MTQDLSDDHPLRDTLASYAALVDHIPQSVFIKNTQGVYLAANRQYAACFGLETTALLGQDDYALYPRELAEKYRADDARVMAGGRPEAFDERHLEQGRETVVHTIKTPILDGGGRAIGICGIFWEVAEQRELERRLTDSEAKLRAIYDKAQEGILVASLDVGRLLMANPACCRMLGYEAAELLALDPAELHPPETRAWVRKLIGRMEQGDYSLAQELAFQRKNGEIFYADVSPMLVTLAEGPCLLAVLRDVTEKRRATEQLARSEALLAEAQTLAQIGNWNVDLRSGQSSWSDEEYRLFGFAPGSVQPSAALFKQVVHPEDYEAVEAQLAALLAAGHDGHYHAEFRVLRPDGERVLEEVGEVKFDPQGRPLRMFGTTMDVTERRRAAQALADSEQRFRLQIELAPEAIVVFDLDAGRFIEVNENALRLFGLPREELVRRSPAELSPPRQPDGRPSDLSAMGWMLRALDGGQPVFEWLHRHASGREIPCEVRLVRMPASGQRLVRGSITDISDRKLAETRLRQLNEELEQRVTQRTAELTRAKQEAERANAAKSDFLSRMSHELRTPLNAILGFGQLMALQSREPATGDYVQEILKAGQHLLELINEVLDLARIESGKFSVARETVALAPVLADCLSLLRPQAQAREIQLPAETLGVEQQVWADPVRLKQVLLNLLSNAVKYNRPRGRVSLASRVVEDRHGARLRLTVADQGPGLSPAQMARLFVPFERLDADRAAIEGTGIGLAIAKRLVELMEGRVGVDSRPGEGCEFWVELPLAPPAQALPAPQPALTASACDADGAANGALSLLCIEDNPANLLLVESILALRPGVELLKALGPAQGLSLARERAPALVLLDINLPEMDGYEVLRRLRADPATRALPVVAVSANAKAEDLARGRAAGFDDYLTKPLDVARLLALVDALPRGAVAAR
ncbi:PAS domain S-box protein [Roseateles sp. DAIF2]|uniref:PAS domain-containing hybrid sensor histidine kinase/response regulator n=1 Tax=Roseateles sp. DAIF2 TaxID=2714952 RepID=UPI0018A310A0|nr:PAS domain S-box protein [Roseateles sp. DAIF2]QPF76297.1 PAS domain S-box protein [Roseateles sp. DAIF2]